jgi:hypothetical protein
MALFKPKGPVNCGCSRRVCEDDCADHPYVGSWWVKSYDCNTGAPCGGYKLDYLGCDCYL